MTIGKLTDFLLFHEYVVNKYKNDAAIQKLQVYVLSQIASMKVYKCEEIKQVAASHFQGYS